MVHSFMYCAVHFAPDDSNRLRRSPSHAWKIERYFRNPASSRNTSSITRHKAGEVNAAALAAALDLMRLIPVS